MKGGRPGVKESSPRTRWGEALLAEEALVEKWEHPGAFHNGMRRRWLRGLVRRIMHLLGYATYPKPPVLRALLEGERRVVVEWKLDQLPWRRSRHLYLTVHDGERVVASRTLRRPGTHGRASCGCHGRWRVPRYGGAPSTGSASEAARLAPETGEATMAEGALSAVHPRPGLLRVIQAVPDTGWTPYFSGIRLRPSGRACPRERVTAARGGIGEGSV
jgi:hypothetical protein